MLGPMLILAGRNRNQRIRRIRYRMRNPTSAITINAEKKPALKMPFAKSQLLSVVAMKASSKASTGRRKMERFMGIQRKKIGRKPCRISGSACGHILFCAAKG